MSSNQTDLLFVLTRLLSLFIAVVAGFSAAGESSDRSKPNFLLIMPDQMRGDCLSTLGHPAVRTPQLDKLANQGTLFRRAYSTCPSCIPARHALLTGLFPATSGVVGYAARPIPYPTLPGLLADAGYTTVLVGRYMHQLPQDESYGYQKEIRGSTYVGDDDYDHFLQQQAPETGGIRALVSRMGVSFNGWEATPWPLAGNLHPTTWAVSQALKVLSETTNFSPIFLTASFFAPHSPLFPPKTYFDHYLNRSLPKPAHGDWVNWKALSPQGDKNGHRVLLEGEQLSAAQAGYFGLIEHFDSEIEALVAAFKERSRKSNRPWVIIVTSDHGELLGDNGFYRKCEPYEGCANIPLLISGSDQLKFIAGARSEQVVCLEDLLPTVLEIAGVKYAAPMDGVSLLPALRGETKVIRNWLHLEHAPCYSKQQAFHALTDGHSKYIWRPEDGTEQLFDLAKDPHEEHDLVKEPEYQVKLLKWRARMIKQLANRPEGFSDGAKLIAGRPYPALQANTSKNAK
jgi:arylsulfatase A-like enzyme